MPRRSRPYQNQNQSRLEKRGLSHLGPGARETLPCYVITYRFVDPYDCTYRRLESLVLSTGGGEAVAAVKALEDLGREYPDVGCIRIESLTAG